MGKRMQLVVLVVIVVLALIFAGCRSKDVNQQEVVVYTSLDKVFSQPILEEFEQQTGIKVKAVYDSEATKTTGLVNRLIAEKNSPQAATTLAPVAQGSNTADGTTCTSHRKFSLKDFAC